jgi:rare lipoprotein A
VNTTPHAVARKPALAALTLAATAAAPALAQAPAPPQAPAPAKPVLRASLHHHALVGSKVWVTGTLSGPGRRPIAVQQSKGRGWQTLAHTVTGARGRFAASFRPRSLGPVALRLVGPDGAVKKTTLTSYRAVGASWYGPGFYGRPLACGGTLSPGRVGVANKTLPCGTRVRLRYRGRSLTAPVIDRGPYAGGRTYDLTAAAKQRLRFGSTGMVWSSK